MCTCLVGVGHPFIADRAQTMVLQLSLSVQGACDCAIPSLPTPAHPGLSRMPCPHNLVYRMGLRMVLRKCSSALTNMQDPAPADHDDYAPRRGRPVRGPRRPVDASPPTRRKDGEENSEMRWQEWEEVSSVHCAIPKIPSGHWSLGFLACCLKGLTGLGLNGGFGRGAPVKACFDSENRLEIGLTSDRRKITWLAMLLDQRGGFF